jgi:hypothetical protein
LQVSTVLTTASNLQPGIAEGSCSTPSTNAAPSAPDPGLSFCSTGSTTEPLAKGLARAADQLAALHFPAADQSAANALIVQLRMVSSRYRTLEHGPTMSPAAFGSAEVALSRDYPALTNAAKHLRHVLGLPVNRKAELLDGL